MRAFQNGGRMSWRRGRRWCSMRSRRWSMILAGRSGSCLLRCLISSGGLTECPAAALSLRALSRRHIPQVPILLVKLLTRLFVRRIAADLRLAIDDLAAAFDRVSDDTCV